MNMVKALAKQSYQLHSETLSSLGIDYLKQFPEPEPRQSLCGRKY
jgi:hypothetical protein